MSSQKFRHISVYVANDEVGVYQVENGYIDHDNNVIEGIWRKAPILIPLFLVKKIIPGDTGD